MLLRRISLVTLAVMLLLVQQSYCRTKGADDASKVNKNLWELVHDILEGRSLQKAKASIAPDAYIIDGTNYESLIGAINGEFKDSRLIEGSAFKMVFEHLTFAPDNTAAFMTLITSSPDQSRQYHSIVFFKNHDGQWKIVSWHVSR